EDALVGVARSRCGLPGADEVKPQAAEGGKQPLAKFWPVVLAPVPIPAVGTELGELHLVQPRLRAMSDTGVLTRGVPAEDGHPVARRPEQKPTEGLLDVPGAHLAPAAQRGVVAD